MAKKRSWARPAASMACDVIDIIMQQPATADYIAGKIYRYFVRQDLSPELQKQLGVGAAQIHITRSRRCSKRSSCRAISTAPLRWARRSRARWNSPSPPTRNWVSRAFRASRTSTRPPARWDSSCSRRRPWRDGRGGQSWITPGLLLERGNFARDILFPDISFLPPDRYTGGGEIRRVAERIRRRHGHHRPPPRMTPRAAMMAESNMNADRDEDFNTRYGSFRGSQMAIERVKPIPRDTAQVNLSQMVLDANLKNTTQVVDYLIHRFMRVPPDDDARQKLIAFLNTGTGHRRHRRRPDLSGGTAAAGPAPDHEPARVSVELKEPCAMKRNRFSFSQVQPPRSVARRDVRRLRQPRAQLFRMPACSDRRPRRLPPKRKSDGKILVVLELSGGNDGLNTLVPYGDDAYYKRRPNLGIPKKDVRTDRRPLRFQRRHGRIRAPLQRRQTGRRAWLRLREPVVLAFHVDGVLAHGGAQQRRAIRLGGTSGGCDGARRRRPIFWSISPRGNRSRCAAAGTSRWFSTIPTNSRRRSFYDEKRRFSMPRPKSRTGRQSVAAIPARHRPQRQGRLGAGARSLGQISLAGGLRNRGSGSAQGRGADRRGHAHAPLLHFLSQQRV